MIDVGFEVSAFESQGCEHCCLLAEGCEGVAYVGELDVWRCGRGSVAFGFWVGWVGAGFGAWVGFFQGFFGEWWDVGCAWVEGGSAREEEVVGRDC